jgi:hypothetical protein
MSDDTISHIEIVQDEDEKVEAQEKKLSIWLKLKDVEGWKKDLRKTLWILLVIALMAGILFGAKRFFPLFSVRFHVPVEVVSYEKHQQQNPNLSFYFSKNFVFDEDQQKKYGSDYLAGFHLKADQRTGCDVRSSSMGINFGKSDQEINEAISKDLGSSVKGFSNYSGKRIKIDGRDALVTEFMLTDPLSNTLHLKQVMFSNGGDNYLVVCGSGQSQYEFYKDDFAAFIESFRFTN